MWREEIRPFSEKGARRTLRKFLRGCRPDLLPYVEDFNFYPDDGQPCEILAALGLHTSWAVWLLGRDSTSYIHHRDDDRDGPYNPIVVEWYGTGYDPLDEHRGLSPCEVDEGITTGREEGEDCNRDGCPGVIGFEPITDCSCHINPPCSECSENRAWCPECEWRARD